MDASVAYGIVLALSPTMDTPTVSSILLIPGILIFFAAFLYGTAFVKGLSGDPLPKYRWIGVGFIALATFVGLRFVWLVIDPSMGPFYKGTLGSRKTLFAHYVSLILPIISAVVVLFLERWHKRHSRDIL